MSPTQTLRQQITGDEPPVPNHSDDENIEPPEEAMQDDTTESQPEEDASQKGWRDILQAPTPPTEIHQKGVWSRGQPVMNQDGSPHTLAYITARFVQDRLDEAVGPENWQTVYESVPNSLAVRAGIGIRIPDTDEWVWKWDVGTPSTIEPEKGAHSDAFKRAGVQWGIARDLYDERDDKEGVSQPEVRMDQPIMPRGAEQQQMPPPGMPAYTNDQPQQMPQQAGAGWMCPLHNDVKVVPAGISKKSGKPYNAFYACPVPGCDQTGPRA